MDTSTDVRDRITAAADTLYDESARRAFPTVDAVRKLAKVNINDASVCMREWRRAHAPQSNQPEHPVPEKLEQTCKHALHALWAEAVQLCGETMRMAQAGWDAERADADSMNEQIATACAAQEAELLAARIEIENQTQEIARLSQLLLASQRRTDAAENSAAELHIRASHAEARSMELGRHADDLRKALDQVHATHTAATGEQAALLSAQAEHLVSLRSELEAARQKLDTSAATAREDLLAAIKEAACLRGRLEAISEAGGREAKRSPQPKKDGKSGSEAVPPA